MELAAQHYSLAEELHRYPLNHQLSVALEAFMTPCLSVSDCAKCFMAEEQAWFKIRASLEPRPLLESVAKTQSASWSLGNRVDCALPDLRSQQFYTSALTSTGENALVCRVSLLSMLIRIHSLKLSGTCKTF